MSSHMQAQVRHIQLIYNCIMRGYGCHLGRPAGTTTYRSLSLTIYCCLLLLLLLHSRSAAVTAAAGCAADNCAACCFLITHRAPECQSKGGLVWHNQSFTRCKQSVSRIVQSVSHDVQSVSNAHTRNPSSFNRSVLSQICRSHGSLSHAHAVPSHTRHLKTTQPATRTRSILLHSLYI